MRRARLILPLLLVLAATGCRHYTGYIERHAVRTPLPGEVSEDHAKSERPLRLISGPTADDGRIRLRVIRKKLYLRPERRRILARRTYDPYHWYTPLIKPFVMVTVVLPYYFSWIEPHNYSGANWGMDDYFWEVVSYNNLFTADPGGPQTAEREWTELSSQDTKAPFREDDEPYPGIQVVVSLGGKVLAATRSDDKGDATLKLADFVTPQIASSERDLELVALDKRKILSTLNLAVSSPTLQAHLPR